MTLLLSDLYLVVLPSPISLPRPSTMSLRHMVGLSHEPPSSQGSNDTNRTTTSIRGQMKKVKDAVVTRFVSNLPYFQVIPFDVIGIKSNRSSNNTIALVQKNTENVILTDDAASIVSTAGSRRRGIIQEDPAQIRVSSQNSRS